MQPTSKTTSLVGQIAQGPALPAAQPAQTRAGAPHSTLGLIPTAHLALLNLKLKTSQFSFHKTQTSNSSPVTQAEPTCKDFFLLFVFAIFSRQSLLSNLCKDVPVTGLMTLHQLKHSTTCTASEIKYLFPSSDIAPLSPRSAAAQASLIHRASLCNVINFKANLVHPPELTSVIQMPVNKPLTGIILMQGQAVAVLYWMLLKKSSRKNVDF